MGFLEGFADELMKTAAAEGALPGIARRLPRFAGLAAVGGGAAALGHALGKRKGEQQGIEEGASVADDVAQRAYRAGVERGASAMREAMLQAGGDGNKAD
jgi:hypothetical protein